MADAALHRDTAACLPGAAVCMGMPGACSTAAPSQPVPCLLQDNDTRFGQPYLQDIAWMDHDRPYMRDEWEEKGAKCAGLSVLLCCRWCTSPLFTAALLRLTQWEERSVCLLELACVSVFGAGDILCKGQVPPWVVGTSAVSPL